jgi:glycosyltransferase involved in cell wall biosynthesis
MKLVIVHHHFRRGGVTRVVENHLRSLALAEDGLPERVVLLHDGVAGDWPFEVKARSLGFPCEVLTVEGLGYDESGGPVDTDLPIQIADTLNAVGCGPAESLIHWHNHSLGKNPAVLSAIRHLAESGYRLLLQVHDFAEDFRAESYQRLRRTVAGGDDRQLAALLYPQAAGIHYAVLNGRDEATLRAVGVASDRLHLLPNPVSPPPVADDPAASRKRVLEALDVPPSHRLVVYPVRGIRRKNLGEFLLWSAMVERAFFLLTLAPQNPLEENNFRRWQALAGDLGLPCRLGAPKSPELGFADNLAAADALITTSVAEGFGMVFLEAWLAGKVLLGRNLPEITADFTAEGLDLSGCYDSLQVPSEWLDKDRLASEVGAAYREVLAGYEIADDHFDKQIRTLIEQPAIDFACLPSTLQEQVVERVFRDEASRHQLADMNPKCRLPQGDTADQVSRNAQVVTSAFSLRSLSRRLTNMYRRLADSHPNVPPSPARIEPPSHSGAVLERFLSFVRFHPLRVEP